MKRRNCILCVNMIVVLSLASSCQGLNDNKIDPVLLTHAKAIMDFDSLNSPYLQVYQYDCNTAWLYDLSSRDGMVWFDIGKHYMELPTDLIRYKGKYILFYLRNKKPLDRDLLAKAMNLKRNEYGDLTTPDVPHSDYRIWFYFKDKHSDKSIYTRFDGRESGGRVSRLPELRYFRCNDQDSAAYYSHIIDMQMWGGPEIYGAENIGAKISSINQIKFWVRIYNKTDSTLYISTLPEEYGHFVVRNGKNSLSCHVVDTVDIHEVSPGMYGVAPHTDAKLCLSTEKVPIKFENTSPKKYPDKIHLLIHDSIYYIPTRTPPENDNRHIWNKRFKIYFFYVMNYSYRVNDMEYTVYYDGEIYEHGTKIRGYRNAGRPNPYAFYPRGVRPQSYTQKTSVSYRGKRPPKTEIMEPPVLLQTVNTPGGNEVQMSNNNEWGVRISGGIDLVNSYKDFKELLISLVSTVRYEEKKEKMDD